MDLPGTAYLFALGTISATFVGFSALIMIFRQTVGGGLSPFDSWVTLVFIQLGFFVTAGCLVPPLLALLAMPADLIWRLCSGVAALTVGLFAATYPRRRRAVSGTRLPRYTWLDLLFLAVFVAVLLANAIGLPVTPNAGLFALGLTGVLFASGVGYLHTLGALHRETRNAVERR